MLVTGTTELNVVTGAFSYTGKYIAQRLLSMGKKVITLTSRSDRGNVFDHKVQVFPFNFDKPGELTDSLRGAITIYNTYWTCFHDLRHTFASLMLLAGVHVKVVSEMLGHSSVAFTLDVYSHVIPGLQEAAGKRLDEVLDPKLRQKKNVGKMSAKVDGEGEKPPKMKQEWEDSNPRPAVLETAALAN